MSAGYCGFFDEAETEPRFAEIHLGNGELILYDEEHVVEGAWIRSGLTIPLGGAR